MRLMTQARRSDDEPKPIPSVRLRPALHDAARQCMDKLAMDATELVNTAVREFLERQGLWPPPAKK